MVNIWTIRGEQSDLFKNLRERSKNYPTGFLFLAIFWTRSSKNFPTLNSHLEKLIKYNKHPGKWQNIGTGLKSRKRGCDTWVARLVCVGRGRGLWSQKQGQCWTCSLHTQTLQELHLWGWERENLGDNKDIYLSYLKPKCPAEFVTARLDSHRFGVQMYTVGETPGREIS